MMMSGSFSLRAIFQAALLVVLATASEISVSIDSKEVRGLDTIELTPNTSTAVLSAQNGTASSGKLLRKEERRLRVEPPPLSTKLIRREERVYVLPVEKAEHAGEKKPVATRNILFSALVV